MKLKDAKRCLGVIKAHGLNPALYVVIGDSESHLVVKHRFTGDIRALDK